MMSLNIFDPAKVVVILKQAKTASEVRVAWCHRASAIPDELSRAESFRHSLTIRRRNARNSDNVANCRGMAKSVVDAKLKFLL